MSLRLIHSADWHLGQSLHGHDRHAEHAAFLAWLLDTLVERAADALIVAGDIFDSANPPAEAQRLYYRFLAEAARRCPGLEIIVVAGNHDSPARLEAPAAVLHALSVHVVGQHRGDALPAIPLRGRDGQVAARVLPLPFLRPVELPGSDYAQGIAAAYRAAVDAALPELEAGVALIATGHLHVAGGALSEESERRLVVGGQEAIGHALFPPELAYIALGHLHRAQALAGGRIRYPGSPLPMSFAEIGYPHQVLEVSIDGGTLAEVTSIPVPRPAPIRRVPDRALPIDEVLAALAALDLPAAPAGLETLLEMWVQRSPGDEDPVPAIRAALEGRPVRLAGIRVQRKAGDTAITDTPRLAMTELQPLALFERLVRERHSEDPDPAVLAAFGELLVEAERGAD